MTTTSPGAHLRESVAAASRELAAAGLFIGTSGNLSHRDGDLVAVTATGARLATTTADEVTVVDLDGRIVAGELAPTSELGLHLGIHRLAGPLGITAVAHTHSPAATAAGLVVDELPVLHYQQLSLGGPIRVAAFHPFGSPELAGAVAAALDGRLAALMANHGGIAIGSSMAKAVEHAQLLEWLCELHWRASAIGTPRALTGEQQAAVVEAATRLGYGSTRKADAG